MTSSLVGSEMCIRDRSWPLRVAASRNVGVLVSRGFGVLASRHLGLPASWRGRISTNANRRRSCVPQDV
eukprot:7745905-Prorocentrum_lima.AAC.1